MSIRLIVVDDYDPLREKIKSFISAQPDIEVVGEAKDGETAVELAKELVPDVVLMDITLPKMSGIEAAGDILREKPDTQIIILSMHSNKHFAERAFKTGASGYVLKSSIFDNLIPAINAVTANEFFLSSGIKGVAIEDYKKQPPKPDKSDSDELEAPGH